MVDRALIYRKLAALEEYLTQIAEFESVSVEQYDSEWKTQRIVERTLQVMIECCVDIANHLIADQKWRSPESYAEAFTILSEREVLSFHLSQQLEQMARFRNLIVHQYASVNSEIVVRILRERIVDLREFSESIVRYLDGSGS